MAAPESSCLLDPLPECGAYEDFKQAVHDTIPAPPVMARRIIEEDLTALGATEVHWRSEPVRRRSDNGNDYWFNYGDGEFEGDLDMFQKAVLQLGGKHHGWTAGFSPGYMGSAMGGDRWVFNFCVAVRAL